MQIHLNGNDITNREQLHDALSGRWSCRNGTAAAWTPCMTA